MDLVRGTLLFFLFLLVGVPVLAILLTGDRIAIIGMSVSFFVVAMPIGVVYFMRRVKKAMTARLVCTTCGHYGEPVSLVKGDIGTEIVLWILFLLPGLLYSMWRQSSRYDGCAKCGGASLVPADSPVGRKLLADAGAQPQPPRPSR
ncbi:MAG: hypothetical protein HY928_07230 [Elusimicrobia bacterium]|nr:hypothetical protein [Elusimicrobiota bacterium]